MSPNPNPHKSRIPWIYGKLKPLIARTVLAVIPFVLVSCSLFSPEVPKRAEVVMYEWEDSGDGRPLSIEINLREQKATYRRGDRPIGWSFVSTGRKSNSTPVGDFRITEKLPLKVSDRYGWIADSEGKVVVAEAVPGTPVPPGHVYKGSEMHQWMRITSYGIGLHAGEIGKPGSALSHGCIRLPRDFAPKLYGAAAVGTRVRIVRG